MPLLTPDVPYGNPAFALTEDQVATVIDLVCQGVDEARSAITSGMLEVPATIIIRKAMRRVKKTRRLTNLQIRGEHELDNMATTDAAILGRIDITLQFLHQFGDEDAYVAVECKRVGAGLSALNGSYVAEGVDRFVAGKYSAGHEWGFMLGYVLVPPAADVVDAINRRIEKTYGSTAKLTPDSAHLLAAAILHGVLIQSSGHTIQLKHILVNLSEAA
ncbi:hypothetical protein [Bosea sp. BH3]|uniref:hypothetical protein n=1 Tax=Bosea sp. BH3 TaxID=2871701 RepID=UPI0021CB32C0|nr:hypothetical protein [Bosea sp. BH3]MCU4181777.1 hypothetical protein [Bosea sp. BH3]